VKGASMKGASIVHRNPFNGAGKLEPLFQEESQHFNPAPRSCRSFPMYRSPRA
jgi:hypothetical protein